MACATWPTPKVGWPVINAFGQHNEVTSTQLNANPSVFPIPYIKIATSFEDVSHFLVGNQKQPMEKMYKNVMSKLDI